MGNELQIDRNCKSSLTHVPPVTAMSADGAKDYSWYWLSIPRPYKYCPYRGYRSGLSFVTNSFVVTLAVSWFNTTSPKPFLKYSSYFLGSLFKKDPAPKQHVKWQPLKKTTPKLKALPVVLFNPMKPNYSFSCAGNASVIADFLNKLHHHYKNHQDFYYFWPFLQQINSISLQSGMGNFHFFFKKVRSLGVSF